MSASNLVLPLSILFIMFSCVPRGGLAIGSSCGICVLVVEGFGFDLLEGFGFGLLGDLPVHYSHFLIRNQLKSK